MKPKSASVFAALALLAAAAAAAFLYWPGGRGAHAPVQLRPDDPAVVARGRQIYAAQCAACHGARLEGQPDWRERGADGRLPAPPHDASGHTWHHPDDVLFRITKHGVAAVAGLEVEDYATAMPVYAGVLGDDDIVAVLSFIKAQWPPEVRARQDQLNRGAGG